MKKDNHGFRYAVIPLLAVLMCIVTFIYSEMNVEGGQNKDADSGFSVWEPVRSILPNRLFESAAPWGILGNILKEPQAVPKPAEPIEIKLRNDTSFKVDAQELLSKKVTLDMPEQGVQVLIMHTHGTEAYTPHGDDTYKASDEYRTLDEDQSVLRVGEELKKALEAYGIKTVHCTTLCDYPNYTGAYDRARETIDDLLSEYPEAQIVIDLHRDAVLTASGGYYKATAEINGKNAAQLLFVVGTDGGGLSHSDWRDNMSFQLQIHQKLEQLYPGITRPMNIRAARFNQHFRTGSMLVEFGTCANYLEEAIYSAQLFADALAEVLGKR